MAEFADLVKFQAGFLEAGPQFFFAACSQNLSTDLSDSNDGNHLRLKRTIDNCEDGSISNFHSKAEVVRPQEAGENCFPTVIQNRDLRDLRPRSTQFMDETSVIED